VPCEIEEPCYEDETAWAAGPRYNQKGNWATYTPYNAGNTIIYAGKNYNAGMVNFSAVTNGMVTITITLNSGFILDSEEMESVKIQGYNMVPSGNPSPGLFTTYKGSMLSVTVPAYNYYGIHLDVMREVPCMD